MLRLLSIVLGAATFLWRRVLCLTLSLPSARAHLQVVVLDMDLPVRQAFHALHEQVGPAAVCGCCAWRPAHKPMPEQQQQ